MGTKTTAAEEYDLADPLLKCFFVVRDPWWEEDIPNIGVQDFPARELHYCRRGGLGNIMLYADRPYLNFWSRYVHSNPHDKAEMGGNKVAAMGVV